jgi:Flp pilus assembly pilin Flp
MRTQNQRYRPIGRKGRRDSFWRDDRGGETVEWPLVVLALVIIAVTAWGPLSASINQAVTAIAVAVTAAGP